MKRTFALLPIAFFILGSSFSSHAQSLEITGDGLENTFKEDVQAILGELEPATSKFIARRQARRAAKIALDILHSKGWLAASADIAVETGTPFRPLVRITKGEHFKINTVDIKLSDKYLPEDEAPNINLKKGQIARADRIIKEETRLLNRLKSNGYAYAKKNDRSVIGDKKATNIDVTYNFSSGPKICLGQLTTANPGRTRTSIIQKLSPITQGEFYSPDILAEFKTRLSQTQLFTYAKVELNNEDGLWPSTEQAGDCQVQDVIVTLEDASRRTVSAGMSFATTEGFGVQAGYEKRNFTGRADTLNLDLQLNTLEQSLSARWKQPHNGGYRHSLILDTAFIHDVTDAFERKAFTASALFERPWIENVDIFGGFAFEVGQETQNNDTLDFQIISGSGGARFDNTDDALDPSQGIRMQLGLEPAYSVGDTEGQFITVQGQVRGYMGFRQNKIILASRLKFGTIAGSSVYDIPSSRRFYTGGGGSVRGYEFQSIGPRNDDNQPIGGSSLLELSAEARVRFKNNLGMVVFVDAGEVENADAPTFSNLRMGAGLGVRYYTSFGPLRFDIATPIDPRDDDERLLIYLSIGQAF